MKKFALIGFALAILAIIIFLWWHHGKHPSDMAIRQQLPGTWTETGSNGVKKKITIDPDGHVVMRISGKVMGRSEGTIEVKDGLLVCTITNSSERIKLPATESVRVIWIDNHELVVPGDRNSKVVYTKVEP